MITQQGARHHYSQPVCGFPVTGSRNVIIAPVEREHRTEAIVAAASPPRDCRRSSGHFMKRQLQKSLNAKRSVVIAQHKTSVSLEAAFWKGFTEIAATRNVRVSDLAATVNKGRQPGGLSSAIRLFVLDHYRAKVDGRADAR
jgi:predicted DNA-binding ribbon-helix-helix protein